MMKQCTTSYENMGAASYLTVTFAANTEIINYQLEMMTGNEIEHLLPAKKRIVDGDMAVYYNITSKIALSQILGRKKLSRKEFLRLLDGAIAAVKDAAEYQLPSSGFVMDPEYIFVDPASCDPYFVFLPTVDPEAKTLRDLIIDLIMQGKLEMANDNFIQVLLEVVNTNPLSFDNLEACIEKFKENKAVSQNLMTPNPAKTPVQDKPERKPEVKPEIKAEVKPEIKPIPVPMPEVKKESKIPTEIPKQKKAKKEESSAEKVSDARMKKFLLPQALIAVIFAAAYSFGLFLDETGALSITNVLALVGGTALVEIVLYREIFVNSKEEETKDKKAEKVPKKNSRKDSKKDAKKVPNPKGPKVPVPVKAVPDIKPEVKTEIKLEMRPQARPEILPEAKPVSTPAVHNFEIPKEVQIPAFEADTNIEGETEIWTEEGNGASCYLEYSENGMVHRIPIDKSSLLLGRLAGQVDFAVSNPKVGKIHAEVINRDGQIYIKDLNSKNGIYINGSTSRINSNVEYALKVNDRFRLADSEFILRQ